jgi:hypothetical protein
MRVTFDPNKTARNIATRSLAFIHFLEPDGRVSSLFPRGRFLPVPAAGLDPFSGCFFTIALRMNAELTPIRLRKVDVIVLRGLLDVCKGELAIGVRDIDDLIKASDRIPHVFCVSQRLFALFGEGVDTVG